MSNGDHEINHEVERLIKGGTHWSDYPGWNFCGYVWFADGKFKCQINHCHRHVATLEAETLQEIMDEASLTWGYD